MGDFSANFHRPESGIYSVEGNLAGNRAALLTKLFSYSIINHVSFMKKNRNDKLNKISLKHENKKFVMTLKKHRKTYPVNLTLINRCPLQNVTFE